MTWQTVVVSVGEKLASAALDEIISQYRTPEIVQLHHDALRQIGDLLHKSIDDAFLRDYNAIVRGVTDSIATYGETQDPRNLNYALDESFALVPRLDSLGIQAVAGYIMACNLHLTALGLKSKLDSSYRQTLERKADEYANHGTQRCQEAINHFRNNVGTMLVQRQPLIDVGGRAPGGQKRFHYLVWYNWGNDVVQGNSIDFGGIGQPTESEARSECSQKGFEHVATLEREYEERPISEDIEPLIKTCEAWASI